MSKDMKLIMENFRRRMSELADPDLVDDEVFPTKLSQAKAVAKKKGKYHAIFGGADTPGADKDPDDDKVVVKTASESVVGLKPSQTSMDLDKAIAFTIAAIRRVKPFKQGPGGDLNAIISGDGHIMDGHHRWVASGLVDLNSKVGGYKVEFPAKKLIAVLNAITAYLGKEGKPGKGSFSQLTYENIKGKLEEFAAKGVWSADGDGRKVIQALESFTGVQGEAAIEAAAKKMADNAGQLTLTTPEGFPDRIDMPVLEADEGAVMMAVRFLKNGTIDINPPYNDGFKGAFGSEFEEPGGPEELEPEDK